MWLCGISLNINCHLPQSKQGADILEFIIRKCMLTKNKYYSQLPLRCTLCHVRKTMLSK